MSEERSLRAFEGNWRSIGVSGANKHNVTWELTAPLDGEYSLALTAAVAPVHDLFRMEAAIVYLGTKLDELNR